MADEDLTPNEIYAAPVVAHLQAVWGEGFLSPGGAGEVAELVRGLNLAGREVLDLGCGVGGPALELIRAHGAGRVLGVDIEQGVLERASEAARAAGLQDRASFRLIQPGPPRTSPLGEGNVRGPLPLEAESFDVVFAKDSLVKITDKRPPNQAPT